MLGTRREDENPDELDYTEGEIDEIEELDDEISKERENVSIDDRRQRRRERRNAQSESDDDGDSAVAAGAVTAGKGVATRRQQDILKEREAGTLNRAERVPLFGRLVTYFKGVRTEVGKVVWPTREEARRLTVIVLAVTIVFAIALGAIDLFYGWWFREGIEDTTRFLIVAVPFFLITGTASWFFVLRHET